MRGIIKTEGTSRYKSIDRNVRAGNWTFSGKAALLSERRIFTQIVTRRLISKNCKKR